MGAKRISPQEARQRMDQSEQVNFLDVRNPQDWEAASNKIPGAIRTRGKEQENRVLSELPKDRVLITYCTWPEEASSASLAQRAEEAGFTEVYAIKGGYDAWVEAGYPLEPK